VQVCNTWSTCAFQMRSLRNRIGLGVYLLKFCNAKRYKCRTAQSEIVLIHFYIHTRSHYRQMS